MQLTYQCLSPLSRIRRVACIAALPHGVLIAALVAASGLLRGPRQERLQLNESTLWAGQPYDPVNPAAPRGRGLEAAGGGLSGFCSPRGGGTAVNRDSGPVRQRVPASAR